MPVRRSYPEWPQYIRHGNQDLIVSTIVSLPLQVGTEGNDFGLRNFSSSTTNGLGMPFIIGKLAPLPPSFHSHETCPCEVKAKDGKVAKSKLIIVGTGVGTANETRSKAWGLQLGVQEPPFFFHSRPELVPGPFDDGKMLKYRRF